MIYHIKKENVIIINSPVEQAMKTILSLGAGSKEFIENAQSQGSALKSLK